MSYDLELTVTQSAADKLIQSVDYPFTLFERHSDFEGLVTGVGVAVEPSQIEADPIWNFDEAALEDLVTEINALQTAQINTQNTRTDEDPVPAEMLAVINSIALNARSALSEHQSLTVHNQQNPTRALTWEGPDPAELKKISDLAPEEGYQPLTVNDLKTAFGDFEIKALVTWIKVQLGVAPQFQLAGTKFQVNLPKIITDGTGEAWVKHWWVECVKRKWGICYGWKWRSKWTRILKVTLRGIKLKVDAQTVMLPDGPFVRARGEFNKLRLDHRWLDRIPLEKLANSILAKKTVTVFDASKLVATVPVLGSRFAVDSIAIPPATGRVSVEVTLKQV